MQRGVLSPSSHKLVNSGPQKRGINSKTVISEQWKVFQEALQDSLMDMVSDVNSCLKVDTAGNLLNTTWVGWLIELEIGFCVCRPMLSPPGTIDAPRTTFVIGGSPISSFLGRSLPNNILEKVGTVMPAKST